MAKLDEFAVTRVCLDQSTCLKTRTAAGIFRNGEWLSAGANLCAPHGLTHGDIVLDCPRMNLKTGGQYELCKPVHAEVLACLGIRRNRNPEELARFAGHLEPTEEEILAAFTKAELDQLRGATLYLVGHYYACDNCVRFCRTVGITDIRFDQVSAEQVRTRYEADGLTKDTVH
ncbi:MAG TPA: hypothetical protein VD862_03215 [Candidatus Paceibacterota bacterium]|nr:hypothetical protein [Candidatus Paceibacterota bacterium]